MVVFSKYGMLFIISAILIGVGIVLIVRYISSRKKEAITNLATDENVDLCCVNCGTKLGDGALFCRKCGAKVEPLGNSISQNDITIPKKSSSIKLIIGICLIAVGVAVTLVPVFISLISGTGNSSTINTTSGTVYLDDKAGLLSQTESKSVLEELTKESEDSNCVITVITTNEGLSEPEIQSYSDNYYSRIIEDKANTNFSVILTVDISSRKVDVSTFNPGSKRNLNSSELNKLREYVTDDLSNGDYEEAFIKFADKASSMAGNISESGERV